MTPLVNRQFKLIARPIGLPKRSDFEFTGVPVPEPGENLGKLVLRIPGD